jgi:hypothetical protein
LSAPFRHSAGRLSIRGQVVIASALALCAVVFPEAAQAHGRSTVVALDYEARLIAGGRIGPGIHARVIDGDRRLELSVDPSRTVVVRGYGGEPFLRFSPDGVEAKLGSPTAIADKLVPSDSLATGTTPHWKLVTRKHRLTWHDHRLGPHPGLSPGVGKVGSWTVPLLVDGRPGAIRGELVRASKPTPIPWLVLLLLALVAATVVARFGSRQLRRRTVYAATAIGAALLVVLSPGFAFASGRTGLKLWGDLAFPLGIALAGAAVFVLRPRQRYVACALVSGFAFAAALQGVTVLWHGFVVSSFPAQLVRAGIVAVLATGGYAVVVVLSDLLHDEPGGRRRKSDARPQPRLAIPKGKPR